MEDLPAVSMTFGAGSSLYSLSCLRTDLLPARKSQKFLVIVAPSRGEPLPRLGIALATLVSSDKSAAIAAKLDDQPGKRMVLQLATKTQSDSDDRLLVFSCEYSFIQDGKPIELANYLPTTACTPASPKQWSGTVLGSRALVEMILGATRNSVLFRIAEEADQLTFRLFTNDDRRSKRLLYVVSKLLEVYH